jgi:ATP-dependent DNA helicase PIF1
MLEINEQFRRALDIMEHSSKSIFITGRAGTGKSTLLDYFRRNTRKKVAVLAPTGVAALNVKGQTIHSFFRFKPNISLKSVRRLRDDDEKVNLYKNLEAIIIDEVSMVRADLLDCVDRFLRLNGAFPGEPFGGVQMVFIGDLYQLPPVVNRNEQVSFNKFYPTPYFYSAQVFNSFDMEFLELEKIYRQHNQEFIGLLNSIRNRTIGEEGLQLLNSRFQPEVEPAKKDFFICLTTTNELASRINVDRLGRLRGKLHTLPGEIDGDFSREYLPTAIELQIKVGSQIMMLNNDSAGRWVNGSIGEITGIKENKEGKIAILAEIADSGRVEILPFTWEIYSLQVEEGNLHSEVIGTFTQYPLMLAWAITIHKSQGKTFDKVVVDIGRGTFAHGQMYVALSRCTSLEGLILRQKISKKHILTDFQVTDFLTKFQYRKAEARLSAAEKFKIVSEAIRSQTSLKIAYLKPDDSKSDRIILPKSVGTMEYKGKCYTGVRAFCFTRQEDRTFRIDRILDIELMPTLSSIPHPQKGRADENER